MSQKAWSFSIKDLVFALVTTGLILALYMVLKNQQELAQSYVLLHAGIHERSQVQAGEVKVIEKIHTQQPWAAVQEKARDTVVQVISQTAEVNILQPFRTPQQRMSAGSAFFINEEGELITNAHVIDEAQAIWIKIPSLGKVIIDCEVVGKSPERDLALLRPTKEGLEVIKKSLRKIPFLPLGNSDEVHRVDEVLTLGYPLGQSSLKSTAGVVSGREHINGQHSIQVDSPINPGSSGGPALNFAGEVIGISYSGIMSAQSVGYIIPINELKLVLNDLRSNRLLRKPFLGVIFNHGSADLAQYLGNPEPAGCYVVDVYQGSPLAKAGIKSGDMIYEINGYRIDEYGDLSVSWHEDKLSVIDYISRLRVGEPISMVFYRKGTKHTVKFNFDHTDLAPVKKIFPGEDVIDYEVFGGMLVQPLTLNHVMALVNNAPSLAKYIDFKNQMEPVLVVTHIVPNSQMQRLDLLREGAIIAEVNNKQVKTLVDFRAAVKEAVQSAHAGKTKSLISFKTSDGVFFVLNIEKIIRDEPKLASLYQYPVSPCMKNLLAMYDTPKKPNIA